MNIKSIISRTMGGVTRYIPFLNSIKLRTADFEFGKSSILLKSRINCCGSNNTVHIGNECNLVVAIPPKLAVSDFVGYLKGKSALQIFDRHPELATRCDRTMWARGYFVSTIADVDEETIKKYVEEQYEESKKEEKGRK